MSRRRPTILSCAAVLALIPAGHSSAKVPVSRCRTGQLRLAPTFYGVGLGQFTQTFTFANASAHACWLRGWPTVALESPSGTSIAVRTRRVRQGNPKTRAYRTVVIQPRGAA